MPRIEASLPQRTRWLLLGCAVIVDAWALLPLAGARPAAPQAAQEAAESSAAATSRVASVDVAPSQARPSQRASLPEPVTWQATPAERLHVAREKLVQACMAARGFAYATRSYSPEMTTDTLPLSAAGDPEFASMHGYGLLDAFVQPEADAPELARLSSAERNAYDRALKGGEYAGVSVVRIALDEGSTALWDRGSCLAEAERALFGDDLRYEHAVLAQEQRQARREELARTDTEYRAGLERFATCMQAHGLSYALPRAGEFALYEAHERGDLSLDALAEQEVTVASADASCQADAKLDEHWRAALQRVIVDAATAADLAELEQSALLRADDLLAREH